MSNVDLRRESEQNMKNKLGRKNRSDPKLQELEKELEFAESRCGTLKQQLDYIKQLYGCQRDFKHSREGYGDGSLLRQFPYKEFLKWNSSNGNFPKPAEGGEGTNFPRQTFSHSTTSTNPPNKLTQDKQEIENKSPKAKIHTKILKVKKKTCRKVKKRRRSDDGTSSKLSNASSLTQCLTWQDPIVEIYKNLAVNVESDSGFELFGKNKQIEFVRRKVDNQTKDDQQKDDVSEKAKSCNSSSTKKEIYCSKEEGMQTDLFFDFGNGNKSTDSNDCLNKENIRQTENVYTEPLKSYCQPTISSKRKQVERDIYSNIANLNIRNIPFVAAKSTTPSHNIGVNIQQVLSIIKKCQPLSENLINANENGNQENPLKGLLSSRKIGNKAAEPETVSAATTWECSSESRKREAHRTSLSHWRSNLDTSKAKSVTSNGKCQEQEVNLDWTLKVDKLKKVLVFLHEDFTFLNQKYKRLQKKLTKRNITKTDAKDELAQIERDLERKKGEITVVIALYKEVMNLKEEVKKLQEKYNLVVYGRSLVMTGLTQSNSAHIQMTALLRKIQNFQDKLKG